MSDAKRPQAEFFNLIVVSPDDISFEGKATRLMAPGNLQELAILPDHTPLMAQLSPGDLVITTDAGEQKTIAIESGILRVRTNRVTVITGF